MVLLRGFLYIDLIEADNLPDCDTAFFNIDPKDTSDPFAQVKLGSCVICKTAYINNDLSPKWQESYRIPVCHQVETINIMVMDKDHIGAGCLGELEIRPEDLIEGNNLEGWYPLSGCDGQLNIKMYYLAKTEIETTFEVPDCYFPMYQGNKVSLYQDAFCPALPFFETVSEISGNAYEPQNAWVDLHNYLNAAQKFIFMSGWSVWTETRLLRGCETESEEPSETLGEMLVRKAEEGVRVLMLIWNEKTSTDVTPGLMNTYDEDTRAYFEGTDVEVAVVPRVRNLEGLGSYLRNQFSQTCYTHHQKTVIMDVPSSDEESLSHIAAFIGGLDVTGGRWDTPEHPLFNSLSNYHSTDFYNALLSTTSTCGPREPWHDIHAFVEGPGAQDILNNFTERWRLQAADKESRLIPVNNEEFDLETPCNEIDSEFSWNTQIFRSITSDSALFDFDKVHTIPKRKGKYVDDSIHRAYIHHIRRCDSFIYIENQYFLGSAYSWNDERDTKAHHIIPQEIAQRISEKIYAGEAIRVYAVIPMFPEGDPSSKPVQEILHWQHRTMEMMYKIIAAAIAETETDAHPTDYLAFFCLGKREAPEAIPEDLDAPEPETLVATVREKARLMVYVHSKMMIVDDDYIIVGSANINQRSMGGTRDSEIAVGAFQPSFTRENCDGCPTGSVHQFRLSLFGEHLGELDGVHGDPGSLDCMQNVREAGLENWAKYVSEESEAMNGHLLAYPIQVSELGEVTSLEGCENFPDFDAPILGAPNYLPNKLTT